MNHKRKAIIPLTSIILLVMVITISTIAFTSFSATSTTGFGENLFELMKKNSKLLAALIPVFILGFLSKAA